MADSNRNLAAYADSMKAAFLEIPTDADLPKGESITNIRFPNNHDLPTPVPDDQLHPVGYYANQKLKFKNDEINLISVPVRDDNGAPLRDRIAISAAYTRVTGHEELDDPNANIDIELDDPDPAGKIDPPDSEKYLVYAFIHNTLIKWRAKHELEGPGIYQIARRLVTYATDINPTKGLGPSSEGRWWLAPDCYAIDVGHGFDEQKAGRPFSPRSGIPFGDDMLSPGRIPGWGLDRPLDSQRFDQANFTVHWISSQEFSYEEDETAKTKYKQTAEGAHWSVVIRHRETNEGFYFDSMMENYNNHERRKRLNCVLLGVNQWLRRSKKPLMRLLHPVITPLQSVKNSCGIHTIANVFAFICYGRIGWDQVEPWKPKIAQSKPVTCKSSKEEAEREMVKNLGKSIHSLLGLEFWTNNVGKNKRQQFDRRSFTYEEAKNIVKKVKESGGTVTDKKPPPPPPGDKGDVTSKDLAQVKAELDAKEQQLQEREASLKAAEKQAAIMAANFKAREIAIQQRENNVAEREKEVEAKRRKYIEKKKQLEKKGFQNADEKVLEKLQAAEEKLAEAKAKARANRKKEKQLAEWEAQLQAIEDAKQDPESEIGEDTTMVDATVDGSTLVEETTTAVETGKDLAFYPEDEFEDVWGVLKTSKAVVVSESKPENTPKKPLDGFQFDFSQPMPESIKKELENSKTKNKGKGLPPEEDTDTTNLPQTWFSSSSLKHKLDDFVEKSGSDYKKRKRDLAEREAALAAAIAHRAAQEQRLRLLQKQQKFLMQQAQEQLAKVEGSDKENEILF
ncbi:hypothetical protein V8F20_003464 [Naviculisporaceae sp. PSN 640]